MQYVSGKILTEKGFKKGYLGFTDNIIIETGNKNPPKKPICKGLIVPTFVNCHTHIGDSFIRNKKIDFPKNLEELVAPPEGLKHRMLKNASDEEIIEGMKNSIDVMKETGTSVFCDFRENGLKGIDLLNYALNGKNISSIILSRPKKMAYNKNEIASILKKSSGIGLSSISDWEFSELIKISDQVKKAGKLFAIHASERVREDIDKILDLKPDFLVHMVYASESDLIRVKESNIPIVLCYRSNVFFNLLPDIKLMKNVGVTLVLGTDNAMLNTPNILDEISYIKNHTKEFTIEELINMITVEPRKALNLKYSILGPNSPADFVVLDKKCLKTLYISVNK